MVFLSVTTLSPNGNISNIFGWIAMEKKKPGLFGDPDFPQAQATLLVLVQCLDCYWVDSSEIWDRYPW